jgi:hypothetical protein
MHELRRPTDKQNALAKSLGLSTEGKSFRVLTAEITDALEIKSFAVVKEYGLASGVEVEYVGPRTDMPSLLVISTVAANGYLYFKGTSRYCRPWEVRVHVPSETEAA